MPRAVTNAVPNPEEHLADPVDPTRYVVFANSSIAWSVSVCEYYCAAHGIPLSNLVQWPFGTNFVYDAVNMATIDAMCAVVGDKCREVLARGIIMGPAVPIEVHTSSTNNVAPGTVLSDILAMSPWWPHKYGSQILTNVLWISDPTVQQGYVPYNIANDTLSRMLGRSHTPWNPDWPFEYISVHGQDVLKMPVFVMPETHEVVESSAVVPTKHVQSLLGTKKHYYQPELFNYLPTIAVGRLGYDSYQHGAVEGVTGHEDETKAIAYIDRCIASKAAMPRALAKTQPVLFCLNGVGSTSPDGYAIFRKLMSVWGYNTKYFWRTTPSTIAERWSPIAGQVYDYATTYLSGGVVDDPYYIFLGSTGNGELFAEPWLSAHKPVLHGGGAMVGPSDGYRQGLHNLHRGGICGLSHTLHIGAPSSYKQLFVLWALMTGMSWLEATYFCNPHGVLPIGDPLWTPYGNGL